MQVPRWFRWVVVAACVYGVFVLASLAWALLATQSGLDGLRAVGQDLSAEELLNGTGVDRIHSAQSDFETAQARVSSPFLAPVRALPVVGRQIDSFSAMTGAAAEVSSITAEGAEEGSALVQGGVPAGPERVAVLRELAVIADRTAARLAVVDLGPGEALLGPVATGYDSFADRKDGLEEALLNSRDVATGLAGVFDGPSRYLLLAANNAEMRAGSGMFLSAGVMTFGDGEVSLGDMLATGELVLPDGVGTTDEDFDELWGFASPDRDFRNLALTPRFPVAAEQAARMWDEVGGAPVDGVMAVDAIGLQALLAASGPVEVEDTRIDQHNVVGFVLHDQYVGTEQDARRDRLSEVARAAVERLDEVELDIGAFARGMRDAGRGRHLMMWSVDPELQSAWERVGVAGDIGGRSLLLSLQNRGANKLDQFLEVDASLYLEDAAGGTVPATLRVQVTNTTPEGEPTYIAGPNTDDVGQPGEYPGWLTLHLPEAVGAEVMSGPPATLTGTEGVSHVLVADVRVLPGDTVEWVVRLRLPEGMGSITIEPSTRIPPVIWSVEGDEWSDDTTPRRTVGL